MSIVPKYIRDFQVEFLFLSELEARNSNQPRLIHFSVLTLLDWWADCHKV